MPLLNPARVTNTEKCCYSISTLYLQFVNVVDFFMGLIFIVFTIYLASKLGDNFGNVAVAWMGWSTLLVGSLLLILSSLSFCAVSSRECRCFVAPTDLLVVIIVLLCLVLGVLSVELHTLFVRYLDDHGASYGLSEQDIDDIENWYWFIAFGFFVVLGLETLRFVFNRCFKNTVQRIDNEYEGLLEHENKQWNEKHADNQAQTEQKYRDLRAYYKNKYQRPNSHDDLTKLNSLA